MEVPVTVSNNKFRGRGRSISGMVDRTLNLYQDTSTTKNSEAKNILSLTLTFNRGTKTSMYSLWKAVHNINGTTARNVTSALSKNTP